ncbi:hypothetical protein [Aidingimonas halophila]|nr:hypothetical protein [Aidingimonas halophila]
MTDSRGVPTAAREYYKFISAPEHVGNFVLSHAVEIVWNRD